MTVSINKYKSQTVILIPVKAPNIAKSRMLKSINRSLTQKLVEAMLEDVLNVASKIDSVKVVVIAPDHAYQKIINDYDIDLFIDSGSGYNECISEFISKNILDNKTKLLIIPADQPRISIIEINKIVEMMNKKQVVQVIAEDGGTGALCLRFLVSILVIYIANIQRKIASLFMNLKIHLYLMTLINSMILN